MTPHAEPVRLDASDADLLSLRDGVTGQAIEAAFGPTTALWLLRGKRPPLLVTSISQDIVFKFEVFTLALRDPERVRADAAAGAAGFAAVVAELNKAGIAIPPVAAIPAMSDPVIVRDWPFAAGRLDVLWRLDWTIALEKVPKAWLATPDTRFGAMPPGSDHACLVATGLLFTGESGERLLVSQGEMPLNLEITRETPTIYAALRGTHAVALDRYPVEPPPAA